MSEINNFFNHKYPYENFHELNLDWVLSKINEFQQNLDDLEERVTQAAIAAAKEYVDIEVADIRLDLANLHDEVDELNRNFTETVDQLQLQYNTFVTAVDNSINRLVHKIEDFEDEINATVIGLTALMDQKIAVNNEYILDQVAQGLINLKVLNYFTGELVTVQNMFDTLAMLHLDNPITYTELANSNITYAQLAALNMTYSELAIKGNSFINP